MSRVSIVCFVGIIFVISIEASFFDNPLTQCLKQGVTCSMTTRRVSCCLGYICSAESFECVLAYRPTVPTPKPRTKPPTPKPRTKHPKPKPRTKTPKTVRSRPSRRPKKN